MPINQFNNKECESCNGIDEGWRLYIDLVVAKYKAMKLLVSEEQATAIEWCKNELMNGVDK